jgi:hypothetical protein
MSDSTYSQPRPPIPADLRRAVEVECGHACAIKGCNEHTYLELHHINENREDNRAENLILLCDKHHKMAHAGVIDRKALREYKRLLKEHYSSDLLDRVARLEALVSQAPRDIPEEPTASQPDDGRPQKSVRPRSDLMAITLEQIALSRLERDRGVLLDRQAVIQRESVGLQLDALRQDDALPADLLVEVKWLRKRYLDGPVWVRKIDEKVALYEKLTGRRAKGLLVFVVPNDSMKHLGDLPYTSDEIAKSELKPEIIIYTYADLGFDPGAISNALFTSNVTPRRSLQPPEQ